MKRKTNKNYKFGNALKEASPLFHAKYGKKGKYDKKGGNDDEVLKPVQQNVGGGKISEAMDIINGIDIDKLTSTDEVNNAIEKLNEIVIDTDTDTDADTGATKEQLIAAKKEKTDALEEKLKSFEPKGEEKTVETAVTETLGNNQEAVKPIVKEENVLGGKKAKKSAKKGKKSVKKGGKKAKKSAKKGKC
jgi:hypothetical protein